MYQALLIISKKDQGVLKERIKIIEFFDEYGDEIAKKAFGKERLTIFSWKKKLKKREERNSSVKNKGRERLNR